MLHHFFCITMLPFTTSHTDSVLWVDAYAFGIRPLQLLCLLVAIIVLCFVIPVSVRLQSNAFAYSVICWVVAAVVFVVLGVSSLALSRSVVTLAIIGTGIFALLLGAIVIAANLYRTKFNTRGQYASGQYVDDTAPLT